MVERRRLIFAGTCAVVALVITWLVLGETSPFYQYFNWRVGFADLWTKLHAIPYIIALGFGSGWVFYAALVAQWFLIGLLFSTLLKRKPLQ